MAKDPMAPRDEVTYTFADHPNIEGDDGFKAIYGLTDEDIDGIWLRLRIPRSKGDVQQIAELTQSIVSFAEGEPTTRQRIRAGSIGVFDLLAVQWWYSKEKPTGEQLEGFDRWASAWVDWCVADAMAKGRGIVEKKLDSPVTPDDSPASSEADSESPPVV